MSDQEDGRIRYQKGGQMGANPKLYGHMTMEDRTASHGANFLLFLFIFSYFLVYVIRVSSIYMDVLILTIRVFQWLRLILWLRLFVYK